MHNYLSIIKLQFKNMFRRDKSKQGKPFAKIAALIGMVLLWALIAGSCIMFVVMLGNAFKLFNLESEFIAFIFMVAMSVELFFGIGTVLSCLYFSKDTEFFLSLPVKPITVFAAKFTVVYLIELTVSALLMVPALIAAGIVMHIGFQFYLLMPIALLFTPIIPLLFAAIISIPIMYIASFMRNRGAVGSILVLLLFGLFFGAYYFLIAKMQNFDPNKIDFTTAIPVYKNVARTIYPMYALARAMAAYPTYGLTVRVSVVVNLAIAIGSVAVMFAIASLISMAVYRRGASGVLENAKRNKAAKDEYRSSGVCKALMKKEWREILRTPTFAMNCLLGIIITPIIMIVIAYSFKSSLTNVNNVDEATMASVRQTLDVITRYIMLAMLAFIGVGTNSAPCTAISREGEKFYYFKILPVDMKIQIKAKTYVSMIISSVTCVLGSIAAGICLKDAVFTVGAVVFLLVYNYAMVHFTMWFDVRKPKLKWTSPNEAVKHNRNAVISVCFNMLFGVVFAVMGWLMFFVSLMALKSIMVAQIISWAVIVVLGIIGACLAHVLLYGTCERHLNAIEL